MQKFTGVFVTSLPTVTYGKEGKKKGGFVIQTEEKFPKKVAFTVFEAKLPTISLLAKGDKVEVDATVESREWNEKWFTDVIAQNVVAKATEKQYKKAEEAFQVPDHNSNLPF